MFKEKRSEFKTTELEIAKYMMIGEKRFKHRTNLNT